MQPCSSGGHEMRLDDLKESIGAAHARIITTRAGRPYCNACKPTRLPSRSSMCAKKPMPSGKAVQGRATLPPAACARVSVVQGRVGIQVDQGAMASRLRRGGAHHERTTRAIGLHVMGKHGTHTRAHVFAAHGALQHGFIKRLCGIQIEGRNFRPSDGVFMWRVLAWCWKTCMVRPPDSVVSGANAGASALDYSDLWNRMLIRMAVHNPKRINHSSVTVCTTAESHSSGN